MNISRQTLTQDTQLKLQNGNLSPFWEIKILLVETNPVIIRMVEKVLEKTPVMHFLRRIDNMEDLHFELAYNKPDLILSGRNMSNLDAIRVIELTKVFAPTLPVIVLASDYSQEQNFELIAMGAYDIIFHEEIKRLPHEVAFLSDEFRKRIGA